MCVSAVCVSVVCVSAVCVSVVCVCCVCGVFLKAGALKCTFGLSKRAHFRAPALQKHHQNSTKGPPKRETKRMKIVAGGEKKSEILGPPPFRAPPLHELCLPTTEDGTVGEGGGGDGRFSPKSNKYL